MNAQVKPEMNAWIQPIATPKVYAAIAKVMADIGRIGISKDKKNEQQGYKFRGIDDVYNALSNILADAKLVILPRVTGRTVTERTTAKGGVLFYVVLEVEYDLVSADDGSKHVCAAFGEAMDSGDKATNKAMSAAYKYLCMEVFCIPTEGMPDADRETHDVEPRIKYGSQVPEDCWIALTDASKVSEAELRKVWKEQISPETRDLITSAYSARWETIKALASVGLAKTS